MNTSKFTSLSYISINCINFLNLVIALNILFVINATLKGFEKGSTSLTLNYILILDLKLIVPNISFVSHKLYGIQIWHKSIDTSWHQPFAAQGNYIFNIKKAPEHLKSFFFFPKIFTHFCL